MGSPIVHFELGVAWLALVSDPAGNVVGLTKG
jgi:hypothetical protein